MHRLLGLTSLILLALNSACSHDSAMTVAVVFDTSWKLGGESLSESDKALVKRTALRTLRHAYSGFDVRFTEAPPADRTIHVEDTPAVSNPLLRHPLGIGAVGVTFATSSASSVRIDMLLNDELLGALHCADVYHCTIGRVEIVRALGRGVGATAAHELGHQVGMGYATDLPCDDCFDGGSSASYVHFFGQKHWSDRALRQMRKVLPRAVN